MYKPCSLITLHVCLPNALPDGLKSVQCIIEVSTLRSSTQNLVEPSFLVTRTTGLAQLFWHGSMMPQSSIFWTSAFSTSCLVMGSRLGRRHMGWCSPVSIV